MGDNVVMECSLSYSEFQTWLQDRLKAQMDAGISFKILPVLKNNSLSYDGLIFYQDGNVISPNFYLQLYYERYCNGDTLEDLADEIIEIWQISCQSHSLSVSDMTYENWKDQVVFRLVSAEKNQELLNQIPYIPFLDLAIIFYCLVEKDTEGMSSLRISNYLMEEWGVNTSELMKLALKNSKRLFPVSVYRLTSMIDLLLDREKAFGEDAVFEWNQMEEDDAEPLVITNKTGINGAAVILYPNVLKSLGNRLGENFYLLPSSIHEMLLIPSSISDGWRELEKMVQDVNQQCVSEEEILSNHVYYYDCVAERCRICQQ